MGLIKKTLDIDFLGLQAVMSKARIRSIRKLYGMTQASFAELIEVAYKTYQSWELGARNPSSPAIALLSIAERDPKVFLKHRIEVIQGIKKYFAAT